LFIVIKKLSIQHGNYYKVRKMSENHYLTDCVVFVKYKLLKCDEILTFDDRLKNYKET